MPTVEEAIGHKWHKGVWRAMVGPKGMPKEIATQYETVFKKIYDSSEYQEFMTKRGFDVAWMGSAEVRGVPEEGRRGDRRDPEVARAGEEVAALCGLCKRERHLPSAEVAHGKGPAPQLGFARKTRGQLRACLGRTGGRRLRYRRVGDRLRHFRAI